MNNLDPRMMKASSNNSLFHSTLFAVCYVFSGCSNTSMEREVMVVVKQIEEEEEEVEEVEEEEEESGEEYEVEYEVCKAYCIIY